MCESTRQCRSNLTFEQLHALSRGLPPVCLLATSDGSGAGGAALNLLTALRSAGLDAELLVMAKNAARGFVHEIPLGRKWLTVAAILKKARLKAHAAIPPWFELFSLADSPARLETLPQVRHAGLVHLHWVAGFVGPRDAVRAFGDKPVVWTLHDMNPLTGGCHCTAGCERYKAGGCSHCPQLGPGDGPDLAAGNFAAKVAACSRLNVTAVSPSRWLAQCAREIHILGNARCVVIPNCIDTALYRPVRSDWARAFCGIKPGRKVIAFGASGLNRYNKGFAVLKEALRLLARQWSGALPVLLLFGGELPEAERPEGYAVVSFGRLGPSELVQVYACADVVVAPSFQDVGPLVLQEAQACATLTVGMSRTGAEDIIEEGKTGFLAEHPGLPLAPSGKPREISNIVNAASVRSLAKKIQDALLLPKAAHDAMRHAARRHALASFAPALMAARYLTLYRELLGLPAVDVGVTPCR
ncbi:MAG: glycosyltransferase [Desulfovibrio sp.]|uniref:glycosyltransferase n=1 Tax=Desulfovibrio sp. TaxID=885 RepID=UPI002583F72B|nr:glycosyltransferase [Desulfovibrio sp.]MCD7985111.1 glycosyltransferase [Desulfovibrio sp.]